VQDISHNPDSAAITTAIVALARSLNLKTIAEGVETLAQLDYLHRLQCDELQGYIFSPPQPAEQMTNILQRFLSPREETGQPACGIRSVIDAMKQA
jgi:EAL domain-containing protein (putative c-di-GMP-specific phosphodiesterase class I)